jgi:uracil-DNA glycosylase
VGENINWQLSVTAIKLDQLHAQMNTCNLCLEAGHAITPRAIYSGKYSAKMMIIGQAPGVTEVEAGRPFNAGSGTRLFGWLGEAGFDEDEFRGEQYMTSVTKCFPGKSKGGGGDRVPSREEQALCRPYLDHEIQLIDPQLIIPVGRLAINLFFSSSTPLSDIIGNEILVDNRMIVPLPHPSGASRWHQIEENRKKIANALERIGKIRQSLGL